SGSMSLRRIWSSIVFYLEFHQFKKLMTVGSGCIYGLLPPVSYYSPTSVSAIRRPLASFRAVPVHRPRTLWNLRNGRCCAVCKPQSDDTLHSQWNRQPLLDICIRWISILPLLKPFRSLCARLEVLFCPRAEWLHARGQTFHHCNSD